MTTTDKPTPDPKERLHDIQRELIQRGYVDVKFHAIHSDSETALSQAADLLQAVLDGKTKPFTPFNDGRPSELRQAGVDGSFEALVVRIRTKAQAALLMDKNNSFAQSIRDLCDNLQPAAQKTEGMLQIIDEILSLDPSSNDVKNLHLMSNPTKHAAVYGIQQKLRTIRTALASRASVDAEAVKRDAVKWYFEKYETGNQFAGMPSDREVMFDLIDHLAAKFPELVGGRDVKA